MDISTLGASGAVVLVVVAFLKFMNEDRNAREMKDAEDRKIRETQHDQTIIALTKVAEATDKNTTMTSKAISIQKEAMTQQRETTTYLKHRNGSFERLIKEQPLIHQLVKEHFDEETNKG